MHCPMIIIHELAIFSFTSEYKETTKGFEHCSLVTAGIYLGGLGAENILLSIF